MKKNIAVSLAVFALAGCGTINNALVEKTKNVEYYRIFDIKTHADTYAVSDAASNGLGRNVNNATEARPIPDSSILPKQPGRFKLMNPFADTKFAALAASGGNIGLKVATCEGASWTANAVRSVAGSSSLKLTACLFPYTEGYHLDLYATFVKKEGGIMELRRKAADAIAGTAEEWTEKTFLDIVRQITTDTNATATYLEGYPKMEGTPWSDTGSKITANN